MLNACGSARMRKFPLLLLLLILVFLLGATFGGALVALFQCQV